MLYLELVLAAFFIILAIVIIKAILTQIKSRGFEKVEAKLVDKVILYSDKWKSYYPEKWEKIKNAYSFAEKIDNVENKAEEIGALINTIKTGRKTEYSNKNQKSYCLVYEYEVDGKKYYYEFLCDKNDSVNNNKNKEIKLKYDPQNPSTSSWSKHLLRTIIVCLIFQIIFAFAIYYLVNIK